MHYQHHVFLCTNQKPDGRKCCAEGGGQETFKHVKARLTEMGMHGPGKVRVSQAGCLGRCKSGPAMVIYPEGIWYTYDSLDTLDAIIESHFVQHKVLHAQCIESPASV